jgi:hypothetical protein
MVQTDVILMPDQRVRVFISLTLAELAAERAVGTVSYRTFATPSGLERLPADDLAVL